ncbi:MULTISPECIES: alpha/beta hydrolase [Pseudomonadota]
MKLYREFTSQDEIDFQYNCEAALDMPPILDWIAQNSVRVRNELTCHLDQRFGPTIEETLDVFPAGRPDAPIIVFIHGGWWRAGTSKEWAFIVRGLAVHGFTVILTNYTLCPKVSITEITRQSRAALAWIYHNSEHFNGDKNRIYVAGHSAGGHQVGMLALTDWQRDYELPADLVKGGIPISGLFDLRPFRYSWLQPKIQLDYDTIVKQSPLFHVPTDTTSFPLLLTVGGDESPDFQRQSAEFADAWRTGGASVRHLAQPGTNHFTVLQGFEDPRNPLCMAVAEFIRQ